LPACVGFPELTGIDKAGAARPPRSLVPPPGGSPPCPLPQPTPALIPLRAPMGPQSRGPSAFPRASWCPCGPHPVPPHGLLTPLPPSHRPAPTVPLAFARPAIGLPTRVCKILPQTPAPTFWNPGQKPGKFPAAKSSMGLIHGPPPPCPCLRKPSRPLRPFFGRAAPPFPVSGRGSFLWPPRRFPRLF